MRSAAATRAALLVTLLAVPAAADPTTTNSADTATAPAGSTVVEIAAADGVKLAATYTSPGKPGPGVLLLHMCNSERTAWIGLAGKLAARGIHSLAFDYRGYGDSGGERADGAAEQQMRGEVWPGDVDAAFELLRSRPGVDRARIGAGGGSCGVSQSITLASRHPGEVTTLVLLAGGVAGDGTTFLADNPWLPILGTASRDDGQAASGMRWTLGFSSHPDNRFLEYPHGGHGTERFAVHADLEPQIADWFEQHLVKQPVRKPEKIAARPGPSHRLWQELMTPGGVSRFAEALRARRAGGAQTEPRRAGGAQTEPRRAGGAQTEPAGAAVALPPEGSINAEGYRLIGAGETQRAIELLAFNVEAFPRSANALDSLGDAYLAAGQPQKAAELARRAIAAIPGDSSISEDLARAVRESAESKLTAGSKTEGD